MLRCSARLWAAPIKPLTSSVAAGSTGTRLKRSPLLKKSYRRTLRGDSIRKLIVARRKFIHEKTEAMKDQLANTTNARDILIAQLADQVFSRGHEYHSTATNISYVPDGNPATPEIALVGRSQSGKTSLLRALFRESRAAGRGNTAQRKDAINFYTVGGGVFNIADTPGYAGTSCPWSAVLQAAILIRNFVRCRPNLKMMYYCMDISITDGVYIQDLDLLKFLAAEVPNFTIVLTKGERLAVAGKKESSLFSVVDVRKELLRNDIDHPMLVTSAFEMGGLDALRYDMVAQAVHSLPSESLSLTEAKKLSERIFTQDEIASVRPLSIPPTQLDEEVFRWNLDVRKEHAIAAAASATPIALLSSTTTTNSEAADAVAGSDPTLNQNRALVAPAEEKGDIQLNKEGTPTALASRDIPPYQRVLSKLKNEVLMKKVHETSPWRNSLLWPANVVPTKHPRKNIMRCPQDPHNPYLTQAHFVAPRADMNFRRLNIGFRRAAKKGKYEADDPRVSQQHAKFTIPYFPDVVDVRMFPKPWMFLGSKEAYYERNGGRELGIRLARYAQQGIVDPLSDVPSPDNPLLNAEVKRLEIAAAAALEQVKLSLPASVTSTSESEPRSRLDNQPPLASSCEQSSPQGPVMQSSINGNTSVDSSPVKVSKIRHMKPL